MRLILNVIWLVFGGLWMAAGSLLAAIVGIPRALADLKLIPVSLMPLGKEIVFSNSPASPTRFAPVPA